MHIKKEDKLLLKKSKINVKICKKYVNKPGLHISTVSTEIRNTESRTQTHKDLDFKM